MSETGVEPSPLANQNQSRGTLRAELPYIGMLLAAFCGIAVNQFTGRPTLIYWQILAPCFALVCIVADWEQSGLDSDRKRLIWTQSLHWLACLAAMRLLFLPEVRGVLNDNATGLSLLTVLALATFLAGLHAGLWQVSVVGILLALAVPAAAWLEQSALLLTAEALLVLAVAAVFVWARSRMRSKA